MAKLLSVMHGQCDARPTVNLSNLSSGTHCAYPRRDDQAELTCVAGYIPGWFTRLKMVTRPGTNRARRRVTTLIKTSVVFN